MLLFACPSPIYQTLSPTVTSPDAESNEGIKVSGWVSLSRWRVDLVLQLEHSTERFRLRVSIPRRLRFSVSLVARWWRCHNKKLAVADIFHLFNNTVAIVTDVALHPFQFLPDHLSSSVLVRIC